jgi:hypothetical protein
LVVNELLDRLLDVRGVSCAGLRKSAGGELVFIVACPCRNGGLAARVRDIIGASLFGTRFHVEVVEVMPKKASGKADLDAVILAANDGGVYA